MLGWVALRPAGQAYPGDLHGAPTIRYARNAGSGDVAGPGQIVWTWVPFEEDHRQGKDRPVLLIGRDGSWLLALPLTSTHHGRDPRSRAGAPGQWTNLGSGPWDRAGQSARFGSTGSCAWTPLGCAARARSWTRVASRRWPTQCTTPGRAGRGGTGPVRQVRTGHHTSRQRGDRLTRSTLRGEGMISIWSPQQALPALCCRSRTNLRETGSR
jgi:hypothetical protein